MPELIVVVTQPGTDERSGFAFGGPVFVGRDEACDIRLSHRLVSRRHMRLSVTTTGSVVVRDLSSSNGTTVEGRPIRGEEVAVPGEATIQLGPYLIVATTESADRDRTLLVNPARTSTSSAREPEDIEEAGPGESVADVPRSAASFEAEPA